VIEFVRGDLAAVGRTTMSHPDHDLRVSLYPVFHIGSAAFYSALSEDLARFPVFLLEGVRWRGWKGPLYDLAARNLGLACQEQHLRLPAGSERLALDMSEAEFTREARALPLRWRALLWFLRPVLWAFTSTELGRRGVWDSFSRASYIRNLRDADSPLTKLIRTKRDRVMSEQLRAFVQDPARTQRGGLVAVVAGAAHMPVLYRTLRDCGFEKGSVRWFDVLEGVKVPPRGSEGRVQPNARVAGAAHNKELERTKSAQTAWGLRRSVQCSTDVGHATGPI